jgi:hypothetical protein
MTNYAQTAHSAVGASTTPMDAGAGNTFGHYYMRVVGNNPDSVVALETSPDGTTWTEAARVTGPTWCFARSDLRTREARSNCIGLGAAGGGLSAIVTSTP